MKRTDEATAHMRSNAWLCGPSKVAMRNDSLAIVSLAPHWTDAHARKIRQAVRSVMEEGKEGFLLLTDQRSRTMSNATESLCRVGKRAQRTVFEIEQTWSIELSAWLDEEWLHIAHDPKRRVDIPVGVEDANGNVVDDALLLNGVSPAYPEWHPRHFPMDALAATRMSTINAISAKLSTQIYNAAGKRAGGNYATGHFLVDPYEHVRSARAEE